MPRSLHVFNALLALVAVALGVVTARILLDESPPIVTRPGAATTAATVATAETAPVAEQMTSPAGADLTLRPHLFGAPLPLPAPPPEPPRAAPPPPPPPAPLPTLIGTLKVGEESRALMKDGSRTDLFAVGDAVAAGTLAEIHADRVVINRGDRRGEVVLRSSSKNEPALPPAGEAASNEAATAATGAAVETAPNADAADSPRPRRQRRGRASETPPAAVQDNR